MRSLQLVLRASWDFLDLPVSVAWTPLVQQNLQWWSDEHNLLADVSLEPLTPDLLFWSDTSNQGWGAHLADQFVLGLWSSHECQLYINVRELWAICFGLYHFRYRLLGMTIGVYSDNTTALAYLRRHGGTSSPALNEEAQLLLRWAESLRISLVPQFIMGARNVVVDSLSHRQQVLSSEWTLDQDVVTELQARWPVMVDLFATSQNYRLPVYFSPFADPMAAGTDTFFQSWDGLQAYVFPPFVLIQHVLNKLRTCKGILLTLIAPYWTQRDWFPDLLSLSLWLL